ncbi:MAG: ABC-F family ATP-binding cassette domain-containing protein [Clostridia bacterium]|nr:ABC-F family ATP-binding cassette domain-containing protein [Clostridia bacterium]
MITAKNLSFGFPQRELFWNVDFTLEKDRHCVIIGSNGSGKTSLLRLIREPDIFTYEGRLVMEDVGRIGYVSQFAQRDKEQTDTVLEYLSRDFAELERRINAVCEEMATGENLEALMEQYQQLLDESQAMDADNYEVNIHRQLHLAELTDKAGLAMGKLSGGEYKLVQVIRQMLRRPGLLMMDEPDVFLDFENLTGLRDLINSYEGTLLVVTHNRYLLNHCFDQIWHLENGGMAVYDGNFMAYQHYRLQKKIDQQVAANADEAEIRRVEDVVERMRDDATQVASAQKGRMLKGKVSYLNRLLARKQDAPFVEIQKPEITLPEAEPLPEDTVVLQVENYSLSFDRKLLEQVTFALHAGEKLALVGPNGTGKTSMLREIRKGHPAVQFAENLDVGFFSQLHEEVFHAEDSIYDTFFDLGFKTREDIERYLSDYCFDPDSLHRKIEHLSGGEKNLLQLAVLAVGKAQVLLLDEPSSHLDTFAQEALEEAIEQYRGAVLMVSHDFYTIANCVDSVLFVENGTVRPMSGRAFRKMIYKHHFNKDYLLLEQQKKELETRIAHCLKAGDCVKAQTLCDQLGDVVDQMR